MRDPEWFDPEAHPIAAFSAAFVFVLGLIALVRMLGGLVVFVTGGGA